MNELEPKQRLMLFMRGFKRGASGSAFTDQEMSYPDFKEGWEAGRKTSNEVYGNACLKYGAELSPLRTM